MSTASTYTLYQYGTDPIDLSFEDLERRIAFTVERVAQDPNQIVQLSRQDQWALQHPDIMGPRNSFFYFGPQNTPGQLAYGNSERIGMGQYLRKKKESSHSRYFYAQSGREFKWKTVSNQRMECSDARGVVAVWELDSSNPPYDAKLTLWHTGLILSTEVMTTLVLNLIAKRLDWIV